MGRSRLQDHHRAPARRALTSAILGGGLAIVAASGIVVVSRHTPASTATKPVAVVARTSEKAPAKVSVKPAHIRKPTPAVTPTPAAAPQPLPAPTYPAPVTTYAPPASATAQVKPFCPTNQGPIYGDWCYHSANGPDNPGYVPREPVDYTATDSCGTTVVCGAPSAPDPWIQGQIDYQSYQQQHPGAIEQWQAANPGQPTCVLLGDC